MQNPLDQLLQDDFWPNIGPAAESGCLLLFPAQTALVKLTLLKQPSCMHY